MIGQTPEFHLVHFEEYHMSIFRGNGKVAEVLGTVTLWTFESYDWSAVSAVCRVQIAGMQQQLQPALLKVNPEDLCLFVDFQKSLHDEATSPPHEMYVA